MDFQVFAKNDLDSQSLRNFVGRRLAFALSRFERRIRQVVVRLDDVNGPRGGHDQQCRIEVKTIPSGELAVRATEVDAETAIGRAVIRMERRLRSTFDRRQRLRRKKRVDAWQRAST